MKIKIDNHKKINKYWALFFEKKDDTLDVFFKYDYFKHGNPKRNISKDAICKLTANEWFSLHINGRFTSYSGQHYTQSFLNIANTTNFDASFLYAKNPKKHINFMSHLF